MPMTPGYYMPTVYGNAGYSGMSYAQPAVQQSYAVQQPVVQNQPQNTPGIIWVDGEVGAKAYQLMPGQAGPVALWDTNDTVIYLKSVNQMGMPNPLQKIHYTMEEQHNQSMLPGGNMSSAAMEEKRADYATKDDLESIRNEIRELFQKNQQQINTMGSAPVQNGSNPGQSNRGGRQ